MCYNVFTTNNLTTQGDDKMTNSINLVPKKYRYMVLLVEESCGVVEVVLKEGYEYDVGSSLACYERDDHDFCNADGSASEYKLKQCIANEISRTVDIPIDEWHERH